MLDPDLFFERHLYNEHVTGAPPGARPVRVPRPARRRWFGTNLGVYDATFTLEPVANPTVEGRLQNQMNVIKLHGFFNWRSADGAHVMIVGTDKTKTIASMPAELVREYLQRSHQCRRRGVGGRGLWLWG